MEKKIIFFDVDGTLVDVRPAREYVPVSTITAIHQARQNGHLVFLCTGRSKAEIYDYILDIGFDGIIGAGGGFVEIGNKMLYHKKISDQAIKHAVSYFNENHFDYYLESNGGLFASDKLITRLNYLLYGDIDNDLIAREKYLNKENHFINALIEHENMLRSDVNKICFIENPDIPYETVKQEFQNEFNVIQCTVPEFGNNSGELTVEGVHKGTAIKTLIDHLGIKQENTIAFGDGLNDAEMLEFCHIGVAVGNAKEGLKEIADIVCEDIVDDGIYNTLKKLNII